MAARSVLMDKGVKGAVMVSSVAEIMAHGLPAGRFDTIRLLADPAAGEGKTGNYMQVLHELIRPHSSDVKFVRARRAVG